MTTPTYREIVITFGGLAALIGRMMDRGGVKLTLHIECDEDQFERVKSFMQLKDSMKMMGVTITWGPKQ